MKHSHRLPLRAAAHPPPLAGEGWGGGGFLALAIALAFTLPAAADTGRAIYLQGLSASGEPLRATLQRGVAMSGADVACVKCHRRSGMGGGEGEYAVRAIAGRLLFEAPAPDPRLNSGAPGIGGTGRLAYSRDDLARALRQGVDPSGRGLDPLMPRYVLSDAEIDALKGYLDTLSPTAAPGVTDTEIHLASIVAPDVDRDKADAASAVMQAFFRVKNGGTRKETRRRALDDEEMYRAYRTWVPHIWRLTGAPETWRRQLDEFYRAQPVFAVVGGLGEGDWQPVHEFCEATAVPCVFPDVDHPVTEGEGYYSLYFSRGIALEADLLAQRLSAAGRSEGGAVVQVFRDDEPGRAAARALRQALQRVGAAEPVDYPLAWNGPVPEEYWTELIDTARPSELVVWLDGADAAELGQAGPPPEHLRAVYFSAALSAMRPPPLAETWLPRTRMLYPFDLPRERALHMARMKVWLKHQGIPLSHERAQANAFFAASVVGDAIYHLGRNFSRDYLIERIEHMTSSSLFTSVYPRLSLGPGQRFAARGGYVVGFAPGDETAAPDGDWLVP